VTRATTPAWQWQCHHHDKQNNVIVTTAKTPGLQRRLCINNGNTIAMRTMTQALQQQRCLRIDDGNDPIVMRATTLA
jgi:hypothetical protein